MDALPASIKLISAEKDMDNEPGKDFILKEILDVFRERYDFIIIDTNPSLGNLTTNALCCSDEVIIPLLSEPWSLEGLSTLTDLIAKVQRRVNPSLKIGGVLITRYDSRKKMNRFIAERVQKMFGPLVFDTIIRDNVSVSESVISKHNIFSYAPKSNGAVDYMEICKEIIKRK